MGMFDWLFGKKKEVPIQTKYTGPLPYTSQTDFPVGKALNDLILSGLSGKNWGYGEDFVNRTTSPMVRHLQSKWPDTQKEIQDAYSARGLGRSTPVARDIGKAAEERDMNINDILAQAYMINEQQKKTDEQNALGRGQAFSGQEVATRSGASQFGLNQLIGEGNLADAYNKQQSLNRAENIQDFMLPIGIGTSIASSFMPTDIDKLLRTIENQDRVKNAQPGIGSRWSLGQFANPSYNFA